MDATLPGDELGPVVKQRFQHRPCIYCLQPSEAGHLVHAIPACLGGTDESALRAGEVCRPCNNGFGVLDRCLSVDGRARSQCRSGARLRPLRRGRSPDHRCEHGETAVPSLPRGRRQCRRKFRRTGLLRDRLSRGPQPGAIVPAGNGGTTAPQPRQGRMDDPADRGQVNRVNEQRDRCVAPGKVTGGRAGSPTPVRAACPGGWKWGSRRV